MDMSTITFEDFIKLETLINTMEDQMYIGKENK